MRSKRTQSRGGPHVEFDQILMDATNVSVLDQERLEGRLELPIARRSIYFVGLFFIIVAAWFTYAIFSLQIIEGATHRYVSENNSINRGLLIAERGVIYDRNEVPMAWNEFDPTDRHSFAARAYIDAMGVGQLLGYVSYPQKDSSGVYWRTEYLGRNGVEGVYNDILVGTNGEKIVEVDALREIVGEHVVSQPEPGNPVYLSVDSELSQAMYDIIATSSAQAGFRSGAGAIMDVQTGEVLAMSSYPSYDPQVMADGRPTELIEQWGEDERFPFLNKVVGGVYTPGSVVKPFVSYAALVEHIITPDKTITSTGEIVIPNPYNPDQPSRFTDWRAHGQMTMREALAFSSNVYMYYISGGYRDQRGMGIDTMHDYFTRFGFGTHTGIALENEQRGLVPNPAWKEAIFDDAWRLGDTYLTSIGQFGFQSSPLQVLRAYAALANGGYLITPHVLRGEQGERIDLELEREALEVIQEGMRMAVNYDGGTARPLERSDIAIAAKSGTAEVGTGNAYVNSWVAGYFPYDEPRYAFVLLMDRAPRSNQLGATRVMGDVVEWMSTHTPQYLGLPEEVEDPDEQPE